MISEKQADEEMVSSLNESESQEKEEQIKQDDSKFGLKSLLWHGGSVYDAWFSCASNQVQFYLMSKKRKRGKKKKKEPISCLYFELQVAQVLLTLPYSFSQLGMLSGIILQIFYGIMGSWTAYLISVLYVEYRSRKEKENVSFKNHVIQVSFSRTNPQNKN